MRLHTSLNYAQGRSDMSMVDYERGRQSTTIDTGDHVRHAPSGEEWLVVYVRDGWLTCCGWPESVANLSDCTLVKKASAG